MKKAEANTVPIVRPGQPLPASYSTQSYSGMFASHDILHASCDPVQYILDSNIWRIKFILFIIYHTVLYYRKRRKFRGVKLSCFFDCGSEVKFRGFRGI